MEVIVITNRQQDTPERPGRILYIFCAIFRAP